LEKRPGKTRGATVVVDRGLAYPENLDQIRARGLHYLVAGRQEEWLPWLAGVKQDDWEAMVRTPSPRHPAQQKSRVQIKRRQQGNEVVLLCWSEGREVKDRAIRKRQARRLIEDLEALQRRIETGHLQQPDRIHPAIGQLQKRSPWVARSDRAVYDAVRQRRTWQEDLTKQAIAETLDGSSVLKTDRQDLRAEEIWRTSIPLRRVEAAFRVMKSPLLKRPVSHRREHRTPTHIFLEVLPYPLPVAVEKRWLDRGIHTSWGTLRQPLSTPQLVTLALPTTAGKIWKIRKGTTSEPTQRETSSTLHIPMEVMQPEKTWHDPSAE